MLLEPSYGKKQMKFLASNLKGGSYWDKIYDLLLYKGGLVKEVIAFSLEEFKKIALILP